MDGVHRNNDRRKYASHKTSIFVLFDPDILFEVVLQLRLYALYHRDKRILALLVTAYLAASTTAGVVMGTTLADLEGE